MKSRNMNLVANRIEQTLVTTRPKVGFNMEPLFSTDYNYEDLSGHSCGTVACIAGHAYLEAGHTLKQLTAASKRNDRTVWNVAKEFLGLSEVEADELFLPKPNDSSVNRRHIPLADAVASLRVSAGAKRIQWVRPL
jgi:hypothetical protein